MRSFPIACLLAAGLAAAIPAAAGDDPPKAAGPAQGPAAVLERALAAADRDPQAESLHEEIAVALAWAGRFDRALALAGRIPEPFDRPWILCNIAAAQERAGQHDRAIQTARTIPDLRRCQATAWLAALRAEAGDLAGGLETIDAILGQGPESTVARRWLAASLESRGDFAQASRLYGATGDPLDAARALRAAARDRLRAGDVAGARRAADETSRLLRGIGAPAFPNFAGGREQEIFRFEIQRANFLKQAAARAEPETYRSALLAEIAEMQAAAGDWGEADATIASIVGSRWRVRTLARVAAMRARAGERDRARAVFARAFAEAPEGPDQGYLLVEIAEAQTEGGDREAGRKTFLRAIRKIRDRAPSEQSVAVGRQAEAGDFDGAIQSVRAIAEMTARDNAHRRIAEQLARAGQTRRALEIAGKILAPIKRNPVLLEIAQTQAKAGEAAAALETARGIEPKSVVYEAVIVETVARTRAAAGDITEALSWADSQKSPALQARALLGAARGMMPDASCPVGQSGDILSSP